jgi:hypothetical protein
MLIDRLAELADFGLGLVSSNSSETNAQDQAGRLTLLNKCYNLSIFSHIFFSIKYSFNFNLPCY